MDKKTMYKLLQKKGATEMLQNLAIGLVVVVIVLAVGRKINTSIGESLNDTTDTDAGNDALSEITNNLGTIAIIFVAVVILGAVFMFKRLRA